MHNVLNALLILWKCFANYHAITDPHKTGSMFNSWILLQIIKIIKDCIIWALANPCLNDQIKAIHSVFSYNVFLALNTLLHGVPWIRIRNLILCTGGVMHMVLRREIGQARNEFLSMIHGGPKITRVRWKITWYRNFHLMVVELYYSDF